PGQPPPPRPAGAGGALCGARRRPPCGAAVRAAAGRGGRARGLVPAAGAAPGRGGPACALGALEPGRRVSRVWRTWLVLVLFALGTSLITPLIPIYQDRLGFSDTVVTLFLGCYVLALIPSMLTLGQLSDQVGRKRVLLAALLILAVAQAYLATAPP